MSGAAFNRGASQQIVSTPWELFNAVRDRFGYIGMDLAADEFNTKSVDWISESRDSLKLDWYQLNGGRLMWLNPPYSNIAPWAEKCAYESEFGARIALLVPASVGANWFRDFVHDRARVFFLNGRVTFEGHTQPYPKDLCLAVYGEPPGYEVWTWKQ